MSIEPKILPRAGGPQLIPIAVHDHRAWLGRGFYFDLLALSLAFLAGVGVALDIYAAGYARASASASGAPPTFAPLARLALEAAIFLAGLAWMGARMLRASYRELPKVE